MQPVGPAAPRHHTTGILVDDIDLSVLHHVFLVPLIEAVGTEQLADAVDAFAALLERLLRFHLRFLLLLVAQAVTLINLDKLRRQVREHEGVRIVRTQQGPPVFGQVGLLLFFIDDVVQLFLQRVALLLVEVAGHFQIESIHRATDLGNLVHPVELLVLRHPELHLIELHDRVVIRFLGGACIIDRLFRLGHHLIAVSLLLGDQFLDHRLHLVEGQRVVILHRTGDDERCPRFIDQNRVHLVDNTEEVIALHLILLAAGHAIVPQVVEAELRRRAVGDITTIHLLPGLRVHTILDATDCQTQETEKMPHPLRVTTGQIVINRDQLAIPAREGIEVERASRDERLPLTGGHLRDARLVQRNPPDKLDVVMHHLPGEHMVAHLVFFPAHAPGRVLHRGKGLRQKLVQGLPLLMPLHKLSGFRLQLLVRQRLILELERVNALNDRLTLLQILLVVPPGKLFENSVDHRIGKTGTLNSIAGSAPEGIKPAKKLQTCQMPRKRQVWNFLARDHPRATGPIP